MSESGYCDCACRDCFEIAITSGGPALCNACEEAGCSIEGDEECDVQPEIEESEDANG